MGRLTRSEVVQNYKDQALKLMVKKDSPSLHDVHVHLCMRDHCPVESCEMIGGFRKGMECGHVLKVKGLIDKVIAIANGD